MGYIYNQTGQWNIPYKAQFLTGKSSINGG